MQSDSERQELIDSNRLISGLYQQHLIGMVIVLAVGTFFWGLLSFFLPDGWWHLVINIGAFLFTIAACAPIKNMLVILGVPGWLAFLGTMIIWVVVVLVGRSIEMAILDSVL